MAKRCVGCMKMKNNSPVCEHCGYNENIPNYPHQLPIGTVLREQYVVGKVLGQGGFGITYIGWDQFLETAVAIKEFYPNAYVTRECSVTRNVTCVGENVQDLFGHNRERFLREARVLAKLSNVPGIVRVHNLFGENNTAYIIMEYVEGIDLKRFLRMRGQTLSVEEMLHVMKPIMESLIRVHKAELVHRDISPDNIMIQPDGTAKLLDFGAAREVVDAEAGRELPQSTEAILKHGFAPIEQYRRRGSLGPWTDVYSLCATIYYCLAGKVPADAPERMMGDDNVNWAQIPGLTDAQRAALEQGMAMLPEKRIASVQELYQALYSRPATEYSTSRSQVRSEPQPEPKPTPKPEPTPAPAPMPEPEPEPVQDYPVGTLPLEIEPEIPEAPKEEPKVVKEPEPVKKEEPKTEPVKVDKKPVSPVKTTKTPKKGLAKYIIIAALVLVSVLALYLVTASKDGWVKKDGKIYYYIDGEYCTGWQTIDGKKYYFSPIGVMAKVTGWHTIDGEKYYFDSNGVMQETGHWETIGNSKCYYLVDGSKATGLQTIDGGTYYFSNDGIMLTGWQFIGGKKCYFLENGIMATGQQEINGKPYSFSPNGALQNNPTANEKDSNETTVNSNSDAWKKNVLSFAPLDEISDITLEDIVSVTFLDSTKNAPSDSVDVSRYDSEGKILAWKKRNGNDYDVYIAADGGINAKEDSTQFLFYGCTNLKWIKFNDCFHTEESTDMSCMFDGCANLTELDLSSFDTSNVTTMYSMFYECTNLSKLDISSFDTSKVTDISWMFDSCSKINNLDLQNWDVSNVTDHSYFMDEGGTINGRPWEEFFQ